MKVQIKHNNNTVPLNIKIKRILICKTYYHSKNILWSGYESDPKNEKFGSNSSDDTFVSNALKLFIYYLFDQ